jgi:hypothetical protein
MVRLESSLLESTPNLLEHNNTGLALGPHDIVPDDPRLLGLSYSIGSPATSSPSDDIGYNLLRRRDARLQIPTLRADVGPASPSHLRSLHQVEKDTMEGRMSEPHRSAPGRSKFVEWVHSDHRTFAKTRIAG